MRQSIGTTTIFQYALTFTLLFAAFLALAVTYNKVYKLKNETLSIIQKYEGITNNGTTLDIINQYLYNSGYTTTGYCQDGEYGVADLNTPAYVKADSGTKYYYCLSYDLKMNSSTGESGYRIYYNVRLFFKFNLPVLGDLTTFSITGQTKSITYYSENQKLQA